MCYPLRVLVSPDLGLPRATVTPAVAILAEFTAAVARLVELGRGMDNRRLTCDEATLHSRCDRNRCGTRRSRRRRTLRTRAMHDSFLSKLRWLMAYLAAQEDRCLQVLQGGSPAWYSFFARWSVMSVG